MFNQAPGPIADSHFCGPGWTEQDQWVDNPEPSRRQNAGETPVFRLNHVLQMLLETEVRLVGELVRVRAKSQHVDVYFLDGPQVLRRLEKLDKVDTSRQFGHSALECSAVGPRFRLKGKRKSLLR